MPQIPPKMYEQLVEWDLSDTRQVAAGKPLTEHVADFEKSLLAKGGTEKHVKQTTSRIRRIIKECGFASSSDITASILLQKTVDLRKYVEVVKVKKVNGKKLRRKN